MRPATERAGPGSVAPRAAEATSSARRVSGPRPHASSAAAARRCRDRRADAVVAQRAGGAERAVRGAARVAQDAARPRGARVAEDHGDGAAAQRGDARRRGGVRADGGERPRAGEGPAGGGDGVADRGAAAAVEDRRPHDDDLAAVGHRDLDVTRHALPRGRGQRRAGGPVGAHARRPHAARGVGERDRGPRAGPGARGHRAGHLEVRPDRPRSREAGGRGGAGDGGRREQRDGDGEDGQGAEHVHLQRTHGSDGCARPRCARRQGSASRSLNPSCEAVNPRRP